VTVEEEECSSGGGELELDLSTSDRLFAPDTAVPIEAGSRPESLRPPGWEHPAVGERAKPRPDDVIRRALVDAPPQQATPAIEEGPGGGDEPAGSLDHTAGMRAASEGDGLAGDGTCLRLLERRVPGEAHVCLRRVRQHRVREWSMAMRSFTEGVFARVLECGPPS
jgi:hypothetical protein